MSKDRHFIMSPLNPSLPVACSPHHHRVLFASPSPGETGEWGEWCRAVALPTRHFRFWLKSSLLNGAVLLHEEDWVYV